jgi:hypothetical protein
MATYKVTTVDGVEHTIESDYDSLLGFSTALKNGGVIQAAEIIKSSKAAAQDTKGQIALFASGVIAVRPG